MINGRNSWLLWLVIKRAVFRAVFFCSFQLGHFVSHKVIGNPCFETALLLKTCVSKSKLLDIAVLSFLFSEMGTIMPTLQPMIQSDNECNNIVI